MATVKEKALVRELVDLAMEINDAGVVSCSVDVKHHGVEMRISPIPFNNEWLYYSYDPAYFKTDIFTEERFTNCINNYMAEAKKHHPQYDADGVKL